MKFRLLAASALLAVGVQAAKADTITYNFDSYTGITPSSSDGNSSGAGGDATTQIAQEFTAASPNFNFIDLSLSADTGSTGSFNVYLLPDSAVTGSGYDVTAGTLLATITDASVAAVSPYATTDSNGGPTVGDLTTVQVSAAQIPTSADNLYWVVVDGTAGSSTVEWFIDGTVSGIGTSGMQIGNNNGGWGTVDPTTVPIGDYAMRVGDLVVSQPPPAGVPEPATLAILGAGLAGLGVSRRRKA